MLSIKTNFSFHITILSTKDDAKTFLLDISSGPFVKKTKYGVQCF